MSEYPTGNFQPQYPLREGMRSRRRRGCWNLLFVIGGAAFAFMIVAVVVGAIIVPPIYRNMEPLQQEIWCNRAENVGADFVCDWKPTPPFQTIPTLEGGGDSEISPEDLLLTPFDFDSGTSETTVEPTDVSLNATVPAPPGIETNTPSPTNLPVAQPTAIQLPTPTTVPATPTLAPPPPSAQLQLSNLTPEAQRWNNCGPTTLTMGLTYFGYGHNQTIAADYLKPNIEDKNVSPWQMINFVNQTAVNMVNTKAVFRVGGNLELLKRLLAADFPVIIEKGYEVGDLGWMGHYLLLVGYDDNQQTFYTFDSYLGTNSGRGRQEGYDYVDNYWRQFNRTYIVLYESEREQELAGILGPYADPDTAAQEALAVARADASANPNDKWAWVNLTEAFAMLGQYEEAAAAFDQALNLNLPFRLTWYRFSAFEAYYQIGRFEDVIRLTNSLDQSSGYYVEEAWYYRGLAYAAQGDNQQAIREFQKVLAFNRNYDPATQALTDVQNGTFTAPVNFSR
ncbi:MAG: C39 family peptidase [Chloroflexi bacterium]|nr:C39 family peptidase [Chloroflexota bacterium]